MFPSPFWIVTTPSLPTVCNILAIIEPTALFLLEIVATSAISSSVLIALAIEFSLSKVKLAAFWIPILTFTGSEPASTTLIPSLIIAPAIMVVEEVPSPAMSLVLLAAC